MVYAEYINENGSLDCGVWEHMRGDTWIKKATAAGIKWLNLIDFTLIGKEYKSLKAQVENIAIEWSYAQKPCLSYSELFTIQEWLERNGKRYGLLDDFQCNGLC